jgi:hypothetical protein
MRSQILHAAAQTTWALVLDKGEEAVAALTAFAKAHDVTAAHFTAIGAFSDVTLGYFDRQTREYRRIPLDEQVESARPTAPRTAVTCSPRTCGQRSKSCSPSRRATCAVEWIGSPAWR